MAFKKKIIVFLIIFANLILTTPAAFSSNNIETTTECTPYKFFGMRGSGQNDLKTDNKLVFEYGPEIAALYGAISESPKFKGKISWAYFDETKVVEKYLAMGVEFSPEYVDAVTNNSTKAIASQIAFFSNKCGDKTKFILAGYSQGAYGVHWVVNFLEKNFKNVAKRIVAAVLLADPGKSNTGLMATAWYAKKSDSVASKIVPSSSVLKLIGETSAINTALHLCTTYQASVMQITSWFLDKLQKEKPNKEKINLKLSRQESVDLAYEMTCGDIDLILNYASRDDFKLANPKFVPFKYINERFDIVADTSSFLIGLAPQIPLAPYKKGELIKNWIDKGIKIHSSYCPTTGPYALEGDNSKCNPDHHKKFIDTALSFIEENVPKQAGTTKQTPTPVKVVPSKSEEAVDPKELNVVKEWFGTGWKGRSAKCSEVEPLFRNATENFKDLLINRGFGVITINTEKRAALLYSVSEGSGDPLAFMYYNNDLDDSKSRLLTGIFWERGGTPGALYQMFDQNLDKYWTNNYLEVRNNSVICKEIKK